jgi:signal transduction histidine kinase/CheY-like chemotaxis protein
MLASDRSLVGFSTIAVLHRGRTGWQTMLLRGQLPARQRTAAFSAAGTGGLALLGFSGQGLGRELGIALGPPATPSGYLVIVEAPLPAGTTASSGYPHLQYAMYLGLSPNDPVLFATTRSLPLRGQRVTEYVDLNRSTGATSRPAARRALLLVVAATGPLVGGLSAGLAWILGAGCLLSGLLVGAMVEVTLRRRDGALHLVRQLEHKNTELDEALGAQQEAQRAQDRLQGELRQAQRLEAVGQLAGGVAHDFNNLLAVILTYSDFIAEELGSDHPVQPDVAEVRNAAQRAAELTRQLLIFSRRELVRPEVVDVNAAIGGLLNMLGRTLGEQIELRTRLAPQLPCVITDPGELEQILVNLAVNARDAIDGDGAITVETSEQLVDELAAESHVDLHPGRYVRISVTDTGCGITTEVRERIFEPFFTTKGPGAGTGLGLSTVYGIVTRNGGQITVYSEPGVGSTFKVYLPVTDQPAVAPAAADGGTEEAAGETVLLVEDEDAVRRATERILTRAGYRVLVAANGPAAIELLAAEQVDLLLTDVVMPGGLSGRQLADQLRQSRPGLRVLYMSGYSADAIANRGILDPGVFVVEKPFTSEALLSKIREVLV